MKNLRLLKPIVFIDFETTGLNPWSDRVVDATFLKIHPDGREEVITRLINPEMPIPAEATAVHGISDADVAGKPSFRQCSAEFLAFLGNCDIAGFNVKKYDLPLLETEFKRAGLDFSRQNRAIIDAQIIYHKMEQRTLEAAYRRYCGKELSGGHRSVADVKATVEVLDAQISLYAGLPGDVAGLNEFCRDQGEADWVDTTGKFISIKGEIAFNFGKYKGQRLRDVVKSDRDYLDWIVNKSDFPQEVQEIVRSALHG